jgi:hypothetical protein
LYYLESEEEMLADDTSSDVSYHTRLKKHWRLIGKWGLITGGWRALNKEITKVKVVWNACDDITPDNVQSGKVKDMIGFWEIAVVFDIKMDFTRKARFCAGGHTTNTLSVMTYSSVVLRDSV